MERGFPEGGRRGKEIASGGRGKGRGLPEEGNVETNLIFKIYE